MSFCCTSFYNAGNFIISLPRIIKSPLICNKEGNGNAYEEENDNCVFKEEEGKRNIVRFSGLENVKRKKKKNKI